MDIIYKELNMQISLPNKCKKIEQKDYIKYGIFQAPENMLDAFSSITCENVFMLLNFEEEPQLINELDKELAQNDENFELAQKTNTDWKSIINYHSILHTIISIDNKKVYFNIIETSEINKVVALQIYFVFNKNTISINTSANACNNVEDYMNCEEFKLICEVVKSAKKITSA